MADEGDDVDGFGKMYFATRDLSSGTKEGNQDHEIFNRSNQSAMSIGLCGCIRIGYQKHSGLMIVPCDLHKEKVIAACGAV